MKSLADIRSTYRIPGTYTINNCYNYYLELHNNGHHAIVDQFLLKGDDILGKQGYTWETALKSLCVIERTEFTDARGEYAGTHLTYTYNGTTVYTSTNYSLFN